MTLFARRHRSPQTEAGGFPFPVHQWILNGDHPQDDALPGREGKVVRYFRHPDYSGAAPCPICHEPLHFHGWIDSGGDGRTVCPGNWIMTTRDGDHIPLTTDVLTALAKELTPA